MNETLLERLLLLTANLDGIRGEKRAQDLIVEAVDEIKRLTARLEIRPEAPAYHGRNPNPEPPDPVNEIGTAKVPTIDERAIPLPSQMGGVELRCGPDTGCSLYREGDFIRDLSGYEEAMVRCAYAAGISAVHGVGTAER